MQITAGCAGPNMADGRLHQVQTSICHILRVSLADAAYRQDANALRVACFAGN